MWFSRRDMRRCDNDLSADQRSTRAESDVPGTAESNVPGTVVGLPTGSLASRWFFWVAAMCRLWSSARSWLNRTTTKRRARTDNFRFFAGMTAPEYLEPRVMLATDYWTGLSLSTSAAFPTVYSYYWNNSGNWSTLQTGGTPVTPQAGDDLVFPASGVGSFVATNDFFAGTSFDSITFQGSGYLIAGNAFSIAGTNNNSVGILDIGTNVIQPGITLAPTGPVTNVNFESAGANTTLQLVGPLNLGTSNQSLTVTGASGTVTSATITNGGAGYTANPTVSFNNSGTGGTGAMATAIETGGVVTSINITSVGSGYTSAPTITFSASGSSTPAVATASLSSGGNVTINGAISGGTINTTSLIVNTTGVLTLTGGNGYTGITSIVSGTLNAQSTTALGAGTGNLAAGTLGTQIGSLGILQLQNNSTANITPAEPIFVVAGGKIENVAGANTLSGAIGLTEAASGSQTLAANFNVDSSTLTLSGVISDSSLGGGTSFLTLTKGGAGTLTLAETAANTYSGGTLVNAGILNVHATNTNTATVRSVMWLPQHQR